jgi:hypothetical protein
MFGSKKSFVARLADAVDLAIDFATLGEYGLEPAEEPQRCEARRARPGLTGSGVGFPAVDRADHLAARL